ncbi:hypothetical protein PF007_g1195 [Phytophthora fragariae]|uniref:Uncharacterized protein n=1 Tax=Phytophthora fragariae TaxID=53985 RepID=A0A6A3TR40_9STRA|nr:hypothetical protein PF007_g1195 [Phytophthora fragariae]
MQEELPAVLEEERTLAEMRAAKKRAISAVKKYKVSRRVYRLQRKQQQEEQRRSVDISHQRPEDRKRSRKKNDGYTFARQGNYGDVELVTRGQQYGAAGSKLRKYGRCLTRNAPIDMEVGFVDGRSLLLGVWRFLGTTRYQQRVTIDALVVEGHGSKFPVGEDWMVERQAKMGFGARELKYRDADGRSPFFSSRVVAARPRSRRASSGRPPFAWRRRSS